MSTQSAKPYIGVTGFMKPEEITALQAQFGPDDWLQLMIGVLVSFKTIRGIPTRHAHIYPEISKLREIIAAVDPARAFALIHYNAKGPQGESYASLEEWRRDDRNLYLDCYSLLDMVDGWTQSEKVAFRGFQFNFPLPSTSNLHEIEARRHQLMGGNTRSVLQVWPRSIESLPRHVSGSGNSSIAGRIDSDYGVMASGFSGLERRYPFETILYDVSGGFAVELDPDGLLGELSPLIDLCQQRQHLQLAVAGGLCAETVGRFRPLVQAYPAISIDAQGKLRAPDGTLDIYAAKRYIEAAQQLLST